MYLLILEDGSLIKTKELDEGCYDGVSDYMIDMEKEMVYNASNGEWIKIEEK